MSLSKEGWEVPAYRIAVLAPARMRYCLGIPVINENGRLLAQLKRMQEADIARQIDVVIADGGSTDGSVAAEVLGPLGVRVILTKTGPGKLSAQLRMFFAYALEEGYQGVVTIDGNNKDGVEAIPSFVAALDEGWDYVQGSRYLPGGGEENTPFARKLGGRWVHAPLISLAARHWYTDTTNGFRAISRRVLVDGRLAPFRDVFDTYNLHYYFSIEIPKLGYRVKELPVRRVYPPAGPTPSKIKGFKGYGHVLGQLFNAVTGRYAPRARPD